MLRDNLVVNTKCFCVDPTCDWLTDSSNNLPKYSKNLLVSFFFWGSIGNDLCLENHHLSFAALHLTPDPSGKVPSNLV